MPQRFMNPQISPRNFPYADHTRKNYRKPLLQRYVVRILLMCVRYSYLLHL